MDRIDLNVKKKWRIKISEKRIIILWVWYGCQTSKMSGRLPELPASARAGTKLPNKGPSTSARGRKNGKQSRTPTYDYDDDDEALDTLYREIKELRRQIDGRKGLAGGDVVRDLKKRMKDAYKAIDAIEAKRLSKTKSRDGFPPPSYRIVYECSWIPGTTSNNCLLSSVCLKKKRKKKKKKEKQKKKKKKKKKKKI